MIILMGLFFVMSIQPMLMVMMMILIVLLYSLIVYNLMSSYWFGYVLVLVMLSGVMVVFTYMVSLMPNESFEVYNLIFVVIFIITLFGVGSWIYVGDFSYISLNLWFSYIGWFNLFLVTFLLSVMVMVVWLSCLEEGAVRVM